MTRKSRAWTTLPLAAGIFLWAASAFSAGFGIFEQGAKATGMGGAFTGLADDPSAIFYNPAGVGFQDHYSAMAGTTLITFTKSEFRGSDPLPGTGDRAEFHKTTFFPSNLYVVAPVTSNIKFGLGVFSPFGLGVRWKNPETFSGRFISQNTNIKTFSIEPVVAIRATPTLSLALGAEYRISNVTIEQNQAKEDPFTSSFADVAHVKLASDNGHGWGWNAGLLWKPVPAFSLGASYRSKMTIDYTGTARFTQRLTGDPVFDQLVAAGLPGEAKVKTSVDFPAIASFGVAFHAPQELTVSADAVWTQWSRFSALNIQFPNHDPGTADVYRDTGWKNSWSYRIGAEKKFSALAVRAGFVYDQTPQPDRDVSPILPDANRRGYCLGLGYSSERWGVDVADMYLPFSDRNTHGKNGDGFNGVYKLTANLFGLNFRLSF
jgi:long-chain fatty acid transport protein